MIKTCLYCGKEYTKRPKEHRYNFLARKYCGKDCANKAYHAKYEKPPRPIVKKCQHCGNVMEKASRDSWKRFYDIRKYCNRDCACAARKGERYEAKEKKPINIKEEYSQAWIDCAMILNRWKNQISRGKAGLMKIDTILREKRNADDEIIIQKILGGAR